MAAAGIQKSAVLCMQYRYGLQIRCCTFMAVVVGHFSGLAARADAADAAAVGVTEH